MTRSADGQAAVEQRAEFERQAAEFEAARDAAAAAIAALPDPDARSELAWGLAARFYYPDRFDVESGETAVVIEKIMEQIRVRHPEERDTIRERVVEEFGEPALIRWGGLAWAVLWAVFAVLLVNVHGLDDFRRGLVVGLVTLICVSDLWEFAQSIYYWAREKGDEPS